jgi:hypothetical protein
MTKDKGELVGLKGTQEGLLAAWLFLSNNA